MIWVADIVDRNQRKAPPCARMRYDDEVDEFSVRIADEAEPAGLPLLLAAFAEKGQREVDDAWTRRWIEERIVPPGRQNLGGILKAHGLEYYDELTLLESSRAESSNDDFILAVPDPSNLQEGEIPMRLLFAPDPAAQAKVKKELGYALAQARKTARLSQFELARRMGAGQSVVSNLEAGKGNPTLATLADAASCLGLKLHVDLVDPGSEA